MAPFSYYPFALLSDAGAFVTTKKQPRYQCLSSSLLLEERPWERGSTEKTVTSKYLTIIPRARVGYKMIDSQRGA